MEAKKVKRIKNIIWIVVIAILGLADVGFTVVLAKLSVLPAQLVAIVLMAVWAVSILLAFLILQTKKTAVIWAILSVLVAGVLAFGTYYIYHTEKMLNEIVEPSDTIVQTVGVSVYVLQDSPAKNISDTKDFSYGILKELDRQNTDKAMSEAEAKIGSSLQYQEYDSMFLLVDDLYEKKVDAIILNDSFISLIEEHEEYKTFSDDVRALLSTVQEEEVVIATPEGPALKDFFIAYISGIDTYGGIANRSRSDVNILAAVNTNTKQILLLSTPRDYYVELPVSNGQKDKLTHAGLYGVDASMTTLEMLYGVEIDYFLRMNFSGFIDIINALGGIEVYSEYEFTVEPIMTYKKGYNHVDGLQALAFARERYSFASGDNQRGKNQMEVISAVIKKCTSPAILTNYAKVMESVASAVQTNVNSQQLTGLVNAQLFGNESWNVVSYSATGAGSYEVTYSMPGRELAVIVPNADSVAKAQELIRQVKDGEILVQE